MTPTRAKCWFVPSVEIAMALWRRKQARVWLPGRGVWLPWRMTVPAPPRPKKEERP